MLITAFPNVSPKSDSLPGSYPQSEDSDEEFSQVVAKARQVPPRKSEPTKTREAVLAENALRRLRQNRSAPEQPCKQKSSSKQPCNEQPPKMPKQKTVKAIRAFQKDKKKANKKTKMKFQESSDIYYL